MRVAKVVDRALKTFARHRQIFPAALVPQPADEIVLVEPLHHDDHCPFGRVVEARHQRALEPIVDRVADRIGRRLDRLERIIHDDDVRALAGRGPLDRGCEPIPLEVSRTSESEEPLGAMTAPGNRA